MLDVIEIFRDNGVAPNPQSASPARSAPNARPGSGSGSCS